MPAPTQLAITLGAGNRLMKEKEMDIKELTQQEERLKTRQEEFDKNGNTLDENAEFQLNQEVRESEGGHLPFTLTAHGIYLTHPYIETSHKGDPKRLPHTGGKDIQVAREAQDGDCSRRAGRRFEGRYRKGGADPARWRGRT